MRMPFPFCPEIDRAQSDHQCCEAKRHGHPELLLQDPQLRHPLQLGKPSKDRFNFSSAEDDLALKGFDDFLQQKLRDLRMAILCELCADQPLHCAQQPKESMATCAEQKKECMTALVESAAASQTESGTQTDAPNSVDPVKKTGVRASEHGSRSSRRSAADAGSIVSKCDKFKSGDTQQTPAAREEKRHSLTSAIQSHRSSQRSSRRSQKSEMQVFREVMTCKRTWEGVMTSVIAIHCLAMAIETQIHGSEIGRALRAGEDVERDQVIEVFFRFVEYAFAVLYSADIVAKVFVEGWHWVTKAWNWFDLVTVVATFADLVFSNSAAMSPSMLKIIRLARFHRVVRLVKNLESFEACILLLRSLQKSVGALLWSAAFIFTFILVSGLVASQAIVGYLENEQVSVERRLDVYWRWGTFSRAVLTMFEVTLGNWGPPAWSLVNNVHEMLMIFIIVYKVTAGFAVLNVINAVFLRQTMKCSDEIDDFTIQQKKKAQDSYIQRLCELFNEMDTSGDGVVSFEEFQELIEQPSIVAWLDLLEISTKDAAELFHSLDGGDGEITMDEWMKGISRIKGDASAVDAMTLMAAINRVEANLSKLTQAHFPDPHAHPH